MTFVENFELSTFCGYKSIMKKSLVAFSRERLGTNDG